MSLPKEINLRSLTIFLIKEDIAGIEEILSDLTPEDKLTILDVKIGGEEFKLYIKPVYPRYPSWANFFLPQILPRHIGRSTSPAALLVVTFEGRTFVLSFGGGRFLMSSNCYEERFGLKVALNSLSDLKLRSVEKKTFDSISSRTKTQAVRESDIREFGLDIERDLLKGVTGGLDDPALGLRISGMDSLNVKVDTDLESLKTLLPLYYKKSIDTAYKEKFPWVDHIIDVSDGSTIGKLNDQLINKLTNNVFENIEMAVPQVIDFQNILGFRYGRGSRYFTGHDLNIKAFVDDIKGELSVKFLQNKDVYAVDENNIIVDKWTAYKCLYGEMELGGNNYVLDNGKWYMISDNFLSEVKNDMRNIEIYDKDLPPYDHDLDSCEGDYNVRVASNFSADYAYFDKDLIRLGPDSKFELCDLFSFRKDLIHVKRYKQSAGLSHLFSQGSVSAQTFCSSPDCRDAVNKKMPTALQIKNIYERFQPDEYQVVYAIIKHTPGELNLPFFSCVNLRQAWKTLRGFGYRVAISKIEVKDGLVRKDTTKK